jgi:hypothetical protein
MFDDRRRALARALTVVALASLAVPARTDTADVPLSLEATAVNLSNVGRPGMVRLDLTIERWSTEQESNLLRDALVEKGDDALLKTVQGIKPRAGFVKTSTSLGWDIQYARRMDQEDGGFRVVFVTDRPMRFGEVAQNLRSAQYEFMLGEIRVKPDGKGEGKLVPRAKITYDRDLQTVEIEDYASQPLQLTEVRASKGKS